MNRKNRIINFVERNKYIRKNDGLPDCDISGNILKQLTEQDRFSSFFDTRDHFIISMLEFMFLYSSESDHFNRYNFKKSISFDIKMGQYDLNLWGVHILKPKYFLEDLSKAIGDSKYSDIEHIKNNDHDRNDKSGFSNSILSFINIAKKNDIIVRYGYRVFPNDGLSGRGYYLLVRKINGRFEAIKKFRWYIS
jgi:hypothetical protein